MQTQTYWRIITGGIFSDFWRRLSTRELDWKIQPELNYKSNDDDTVWSFDGGWFANSPSIDSFHVDLITQRFADLNWNGKYIIDYWSSRISFKSNLVPHSHSLRINNDNEIKFEWRDVCWLIGSGSVRSNQTESQCPLALCTTATITEKSEPINKKTANRREKSTHTHSRSTQHGDSTARKKKRKKINTIKCQR